MTFNPESMREEKDKCKKCGKYCFRLYAMSDDEKAPKTHCRKCKQKIKREKK